ncbi:MAG: glycosyltransferase family 2 protein [candidate division Zixibacteria bacterium]|nr:glycosyltransferase family 2 protein [candidate division Zixibacteria bacterium]
MAWVFWISLGLIVYTYLGYPLLLLILGWWRVRPIARGAIYPRVSLIIPVYNQESRIQRKLENTFALDYPADRLEIIVAFDGSTDRSYEIASKISDPRLRLLPLGKRRGKHYAQGEALDIATGEIVVLTDAGITLPPDSLKRMVSNFADPAVGCVSSVDKVIDDKGDVNAEGAYIRYDMFLRKAESAIGSSTGMSGSFYALRRDLTDPWIPDLSNDFYVPLLAVMRGYRAVLDDGAIGYYMVVASYGEEFTRKVRTIVHGIDVLICFSGILNPFRFGFYSLEVISHKLLRWLIPFLMLATLISNLFLLGNGIAYNIMLGGQAVLYLVAIVARIMPRLQEITIVRLVYFFVVVNLSILYAWYKRALGDRYILWEPSKR